MEFEADTELYQAVIDQLTLDARIQPGEIGISVIYGVVILTGCTDSVNKKCIAEQVAKRIAGVRGVVNDIIENLIEVTGTQTVDGFDLAGQGDKMTRLALSAAEG